MSKPRWRCVATRAAMRPPGSGARPPGAGQCPLLLSIGPRRCILHRRPPATLSELFASFQAKNVEFEARRLLRFDEDNLATREELDRVWCQFDVVVECPLFQEMLCVMSSRLVDKGAPGLKQQVLRRATAPAVSTRQVGRRAGRCWLTRPILRQSRAGWNTGSSEIASPGRNRGKGIGRLYGSA